MQELYAGAGRADGPVPGGERFSMSLGANQVPIFQHVVQTYASETNKTVGVWRTVPAVLLDFKPHEKTNSICTILVHQLLSERRFFAQFVGTEEPPVDELLPAGEKPVVQAYIDKYIWLVKQRLP